MRQINIQSSRALLRQFFLKLGLICILILSFFQMAFGQINDTYPIRTITFVVPYTTGSTADLLARNIGNFISQKWGVPVVVDNRSGAAGIIGTDFVAKSPNDGYTFLFTATSHASVPAIKNKLPYDPINSFTPIILLCNSAMGIVINPNLPFQQFSEFEVYVKTHPSSYSYSSPGSGTTQHLAMELLKQKTGMEILHVPYKGISGAITDIIGGHVQAGIVSLQAASSYIQSGQLRMLAVLIEERSKSFLSIPTLKQQGVNEVVDTWYGVLAPANLKPQIANKINLIMNQAITSPEIQELMNKQGLVSVGGSSFKMGSQLQNEIPKWKSVVKNGNIKAE